MDVRIIRGIHPGELLDFCLNEISSEAIKWPEKRAFILVPEQTKADMERRLLHVRRNRCKADSAACAGSNALMLVDVLSFARLAHRILSEVGGVPENVLDDAGETMLIHRVLSEGRADFTELSALSDRIGFVPDIQNILGDFQRYHVTPELLQTTVHEGNDPRFCAKMKDFALLMDRLSTLKTNLGYSFRSDLFDRFSQTLGFFRGEQAANWPLNRLSYLRQTSIWVLGFGQLRDFTPQESEILSKLSAVCERMTVSVLADAVPISPNAAADGSEAFYFGRRTLAHLRERFPGSSVESVPIDDTNPSFIRTLARRYAERDDSKAADDSRGVRLLRLKNPTDELQYVAGEIRRLVLVEGYRYGDINVVFCSPPRYESVLRAVFSEYGLDPFLDKRRPLLGTAFTRFALALLDLGTAGWSFEPLMSCLKSGICHIPSADVDRLENFCLEQGLFRGYRLFSRERFTEQNDPDGKMLSIVERVLYPIRDFVDAIGREKTGQGRARVMLQFFSEYGDRMPSGLAGVAGQVDALATEWVHAGNQDVALALISSYHAWIDLLERLAGPMGETEMSLLNFRNMLASGMDAVYFGAIPSYLDQIQISDTRRAAQRTAKAVFVIGMGSNVFPYSAVREGYLRGTERDALSASLQVPFPSRARDQVYADSSAAYAILDSATELLYLSCPETEEPSSLITLTRNVAPDIREITTNPMTGHDPRLFSSAPLLRFGLSLEDDPSYPVLRSLLPELYPDFSLPRRESDPFDVKIRPELLRQRYRDVEKMSVSQIEIYAACPYQHFGRYVLSLKERPVFESAANVVGSLLHRVLELSLEEYRTARAAAPDDATRDRVYAEFVSRDFEKWAKSLVEEATFEAKEPVARDPVFQAGDGRRMIRTAGHSLEAVFRSIEPGGYTPEYLEWKFGGDSAADLSISLSTGMRVQFRGTIDRVDTDTASGQFRIVDYKSGNKVVSYSSLYHGLSVQLPAYLYAYQTAFPSQKPGAAGYFHVTSPLFPAGFPGDKPDAARELLARDKFYALRSIDVDGETLRRSAEYAVFKIRENCESLFGGEFSAHPRLLPERGAKPACEYCVYTAVCGIDPSRPPCRRLKPIPDTLREDGKRSRDKDRFAAALSAEHKEGRANP